MAWWKKNTEPSKNEDQINLLMLRLVMDVSSKKCEKAFGRKKPKNCMKCSPCVARAIRAKLKQMPDLEEN